MTLYHYTIYIPVIAQSCNTIADLQRRFIKCVIFVDTTHLKWVCAHSVVPVLSIHSIYRFWSSMKPTLCILIPNMQITEALLEKGPKQAFLHINLHFSYFTHMLSLHASSAFTGELFLCLYLILSCTPISLSGFLTLLSGRLTCLNE